MHRFVPLVFGLFGSASEALQMAAADVLTEIVAKRMEPVAKLALVQQLNVAPVCARWRDALPGAHRHGIRHWRWLEHRGNELKALCMF